MRGKKLLAAFLLGTGLCFIPVLGYGEIQEWMRKEKASFLEVCLLNVRITYMMINPDNFLNVGFVYDPDGKLGRRVFPEGVNTKNKIIVRIEDTRDEFVDKSSRDLLTQFWVELMSVYSVLDDSCATSMNTDIVGIFYSGDKMPLGYFYQGEYYLWEK